MSTKWGYEQGAKMLSEMEGHAKGGRIGVPRVKTKIAAPKVKINIRPAMPTPAIAAPASAAPMMPGMKKGGKVKVRAHVRSYGKGGDVKKDKAAVPARLDEGENVAKSTNEKGYSKGGNFIQKMNMKKGALHKQLGVPKDEKIPAKKLAAAAKKGGELGKPARLAATLKNLGHAKGGKVKCMAAGGAAKVRRGAASADGKPTPPHIPSADKKMAGSKRAGRSGVSG